MSYISADLFTRRMCDKLAAADQAASPSKAIGQAKKFIGAGLLGMGMDRAKQIAGKAKEKVSQAASYGTGLAGKAGTMAGNKWNSMSTSQRAGMLAGLGGAGALGAGYAAYKAYKNRKAKKQADQSPAEEAAKKAEEAKQAYYSGLYWL